MSQVLTEIKQHILYITINREDKMNALNSGVIAEIGAAIETLNQTPELVGAILKGAGVKAFAAGADIAEFASFSVEEGAALAQKGHNIFNSIEQSKKPVIAVVHGFALGGGCELAMSCHMRIASVKAKFGQPEVNLGVVPGYGATQRLVQLVGKGKAIELLTTGNMIGAEEAHRLGLVNHVTEIEEAEAKAEELLGTIAKKGPNAVGTCIRLVNDYFNKDVDGFASEVTAFGECFTTAEFVEGTGAFLEKRKAEFKRN